MGTKKAKRKDIIIIVLLMIIFMLFNSNFKISYAMLKDAGATVELK